MEKVERIRGILFRGYGANHDRMDVQTIYFKPTLSEIKSILGVSVIDIVDAIPDDSKYTLICDDEGKINGTDWQTIALYTPEGRPYDIVYGDCIICGTDEYGDLISLTEEEITTFLCRQMIMEYNHIKSWLLGQIPFNDITPKDDKEE